MLGVILIIIGVIGKIVQANAWFVIPNVVITGLFITGGVIIVIQVIGAFLAWRKAKKFDKDFFDNF